MDTNELTQTPLARREVLRLGALGTAALGLGGLVSLSDAAEPLLAASIPMDDITTANDEKEYRMKLMTLGGLSLRSAQFGKKKAVNPDLKVFAAFEATEQKMIGQVLKEMNTPMMPMPQMAKDAVAKHESTEGEEFDKVFASSQLLVHKMLKDLNENYLERSRNSSMKEMHARHLAMFALPAIMQHIAQTTAYSKAVGAPMA